ncbi:uncharacterized protein TRIADDRAFT_54441 [Trichoplax adhaerens]|uniref:NR LBD domain-containing protein n=1 Tax=Trichoplax adhaerens TaxID=10228 RepID=B3RS15_TRIAD|nr:hypothetical protein TRIADDRAFT_54441 [Trichoplax adhaerens]EDV26969.1 hypothetical protein TRIADDRAFT_54441 [Trichoplax adhaerens]|eukprot:XP_002110965.1 hypothetical protein TRIADDRAFT_54441 [Trichoplax adhaerens]
MNKDAVQNEREPRSARNKMLSVHAASLHQQPRMTISIHESPNNQANSRSNPPDISYRQPYPFNSLTNIYYPPSLTVSPLGYSSIPSTPSTTAPLSTIQPNFYHHSRLRYHPNSIIPPLPTSMQANYLIVSSSYRNAIELLNNVVKWVKSSSQLNWLLSRDLSTLIEYNWVDLFIIFANRWRFTFNTEDIIASLDLHFDGADIIKDITLSTRTWMDINFKLSSYQLDSNEYEFLLLILFLRSGKWH